MVTPVLSTAFTQAPIGMVVADLGGRVLLANDAYGRISGDARAGSAGRTLADLSLTPEPELTGTALQRRLQQPMTSCQVETRLQHANGHHIWAQLDIALVRDAGGLPQYLLVQVQDISARKALEGRLTDLADHDVLTGVYNKRRFDDALLHELQKGARYGDRGAMLLLDLDHFKAVNDEHGHKAGDERLVALAALLRRRLRDTDVLARLGGDEFGVILPHADARAAETMAEDLVAVVRRELGDPAATGAAVTISVGVVCFDGLTRDEIIAAADLAVYEAKAAGRNRVALYRPPAGRTPRLHSRMSEAERIRRAIANDQLELFAQPIVDFATAAITAHELLVRLRTDDGTLLTPGDFLYVAERFGSVVAIDTWVVGQATAIIAAHEATGTRLTLSMNVSARSIDDPTFLPAIDHALDTTRVDPSRLVFELTETATIGSFERAKAFITSLRDRGCRIALDDFGMGFGAFRYLKHLPFDMLKIDGDFVRGFDSNTTDRLVVEAIVSIARGLGKSTIAEFVTDAASADRLHLAGVDAGQGFHYGAPRPIADALAAVGKVVTQ